MSTQCLERIDRVGIPRAIDLERAHVEGGVVLDSGTAHRHAVVRIAHFDMLLEHRISRRHEDDPVQLKRIARLFSADQMPHVNRIERTSHDAETIRPGRILLSERIEAIADNAHYART